MTDRIIKAYMVLRDISQKELAEIIGISVTNLNHKINGKLPFNSNEMKIISTALKRPVEELFFTKTISKLKIEEVQTA